jgi:serine/threonine protein phosphatase 1
MQPSCIRPGPFVQPARARERRYGIVHADLPPGRDWETFLRDLERGDPIALEYALWSRSRALRGSAGPVAGVCAVYCGHTPLPTPRRVGNVHFIDTGACYHGTLTLLRLGACRT